VPGYLLDTGVWVALTFVNHPGHALARAAMLRASNAQPVILCRFAEQGFLRLATTRSIYSLYGVADMSNRLALDLLDLLLGQPNVVRSEEAPGLTSRWRQLAALPTPSPKVWMDAYLAAFAITGLLTLVTLDKDFAVYKDAGLRFELLRS
jgi:toxin-antitoxin system PIN domain toxin